MEGEEQEEAISPKLKSHNPKRNIAWERMTPTQPVPKKESEEGDESRGEKIQNGEDKGPGRRL